MLGVSGLTLSGLEPQRVPSLMRLTYSKDCILVYRHMYLCVIQGLHRYFTRITQGFYRRDKIGLCKLLVGIL